MAETEEKDAALKRRVDKLSADIEKQRAENERARQRASETRQEVEIEREGRARSVGLTRSDHD